MFSKKFGISILLFGLLNTVCIADDADSKKKQEQSPTKGFVTVKEKQFLIDGEDYNFVGANMWYGAYLGSRVSRAGSRIRIYREMRELEKLGITNLRVLGASEDSPSNSVKPAIFNSKGEINEDVMIGLDFLLNAMSRHGMKAVIYLNNFSDWSGGMASYLSWTKKGSNLVSLSDTQDNWPAYASFTSEFYSEPKAVELYKSNIEKILNRKNRSNGKLYKDDPTIMAWQLANAPRPGHGEQGKKNLSAYYAWIKDTAKLIKSIDKNHLVTVGSEGTMGCLEMEECVINSHKETGVDYVTFHLRAEDWGWFDGKKPKESFKTALKKTDAYIEQHIKLGDQLKMPLVLEDFSLGRNNGNHTAGSATGYRDDLFAHIYGKVEESVKKKSALVGSNFWAWAGAGRPEHDDAKWQEGDYFYTGDTPKQIQGLNSVFDADKSTMHIIYKHSKALDSL